MTAFVLSFGGLLALMGIVTAWLFRSAAAPFWQKIAISTLTVALGCYAPFSVSGMMGFPVYVAFDQLPERAELVAFVAHDEEKTADLWLREIETPRAYETELTGSLKKTLRQAQERQARGERTMLVKRGTDAHTGTHAPVLAEDSTHTSSEYEVDADAFALPKKEGE